MFFFVVVFRSMPYKKFDIKISLLLRVYVEINFKCLGDWVGHNGERYMALLDVQDNTGNGVERRPRYRCAVRNLASISVIDVASFPKLYQTINVIATTKEEKQNSGITCLKLYFQLNDTNIHTIQLCTIVVIRLIPQHLMNI